jgi:hypothetical protein
MRWELGRGCFWELVLGSPYWMVPFPPGGGWRTGCWGGGGVGCSPLWSAHPHPVHLLFRLMSERSLGSWEDGWRQGRGTPSRSSRRVRHCLGNECFGYHWQQGLLARLRVCYHLPQHQWSRPCSGPLRDGWMEHGMWAWVGDRAGKLDLRVDLTATSPQERETIGVSEKQGQNKTALSSGS